MKEEDRKKLIELLGNSFAKQYGKRGLLTAPHTADDLISNGVTFATDNNVGGKWIPVTERLPDTDGNYIVTACDKECSYGDGIWYDTVVVEAEYYEGTWAWNENGTEWDISCFVTHWMPLPEPPKGE